MFSTVPLSFIVNLLLFLLLSLLLFLLLSLLLYLLLFLLLSLLLYLLLFLLLSVLLYLLLFLLLSLLLYLLTSGISLDISGPWPFFRRHSTLEPPALWSVDLISGGLTSRRLAYFCFCR